MISPGNVLQGDIKPDIITNQKRSYHHKTFYLFFKYALKSSRNIYNLSFDILITRNIRLCMVINDVCAVSIKTMSTFDQIVASAKRLATVVQ